MIILKTNNLEFDDEMKIKHLDYHHNEFFFELLKTVDVLVQDNLKLFQSTNIKEKDFLENRKNAIELLTNICC